MKSTYLVLPLFAALAANCLTANADVILSQVYSVGRVEAYPVGNSDGWQTSPSGWGTYAASVSGADPGPPSGSHTADASANLSRTHNSFSISGAASVSAETDLFGMNFDYAASNNSITFSTSIPMEFLLALTESEPGLVRVDRLNDVFATDQQSVLTPGVPVTLAPGNYSFLGSGEVLATNVAQSASQNFSATLSFAAVPEPSSFISLAICAVGLTVRRNRRTHK